MSINFFAERVDLSIEVFHFITLIIPHNYNNTMMGITLLRVPKGHLFIAFLPQGFKELLYTQQVLATSDCAK